MYSQGHFTESTFTYELNELVVIKGCWWDLVVSLYIGFNELDDLVSLIENVFVQCYLVRRRSFLSRNGRPLGARMSFHRLLHSCALSLLIFHARSSVTILLN